MTTSASLADITKRSFGAFIQAIDHLQQVKKNVWHAKQLKGDAPHFCRDLRSRALSAWQEAEEIREVEMRAKSNQNELADAVFRAQLPPSPMKYREIEKTAILIHGLVEQISQTVLEADALQKELDPLLDIVQKTEIERSKDQPFINWAETLMNEAVQASDEAARAALVARLAGETLQREINKDSRDFEAINNAASKVTDAGQKIQHLNASAKDAVQKLERGPNNAILSSKGTAYVATCLEKASQAAGEIINIENEIIPRAKNLLEATKAYIEADKFAKSVLN